MKRNKRALKVIMSAAVSASVLATGLVAIADQTATQETHIKGALQSVIIPQIPVKAASLVAQADRDAKLKTAIMATQEAIAMNPSLSVSVVGAIAKAEPSVAPEVAMVAAGLQPENISAITKAAITAAPKNTQRIVNLLAKSNPLKFEKVVMGASLAAPDASRAIWNGVNDALPGLRVVAEQAASPQFKALFDSIAANGDTETATTARIYTHVLNAVVNQMLADFAGQEGLTSTPTWQTLASELLRATADNPTSSGTAIIGQVAGQYTQDPNLLNAVVTNADSARSSALQNVSGAYLLATETDPVNIRQYSRP